MSQYAVKLVDSLAFDLLRNREQCVGWSRDGTWYDVVEPVFVAQHNFDGLGR